MAQHLIGREHELNVATATLLRSGNVLVAGSAGIGKTRLLGELADVMLARGSEVIRISGNEATAVVPLAPLLRLCPQGADDVGAAIIAELYRRSQTGPVAVLVDDAHLLDDATAAIVRQVAAVDAIGLAVALRSGEPTPPAIESIDGDGLATSLVLGELSEEGTFELIEDTLGPTSPGAAAFLFERSRGHPLYLRELVLGGRETGSLRQVSGQWEVTEAPIWSARLTALVERRLTDLDPALQDALELLALGGGLAMPVVDALISRPVLARLDELWLVRVRDGRAEIDHPLFTSAIVAGLDEAEARQRRLLIANAIEACSQPPETLAAPLHRLDAGLALDRDELHAALGVALDFRVPRVAERLARTVLDRFDDDGARMALVEALAMQWRWSDAEAVFDELRIDVENADEHEQTFLERWATMNVEYREDPEAAMAWLQRIHAALPTSRLLNLQALRGRMFVDNLDDVISAHDAYATEHDLEEAELDLMAVNVATCATHSGLFRRALDLIDERPHRLDQMDPVERVRLVTSGAVALAMTHGYDAALGWMNEEERRVAALGDADAEVVTYGVHGVVLSQIGRHADAVATIEKALDLTQYARHRRHVAMAVAQYAASLVMLAERDGEAAALLEQEASMPPGARFLSAPIAAMGSSIIAARSGEDPAPAIEEGLAAARLRGARVHEMTLLWQLAHVGGRPVEAAANLAEVADYIGGGLASILADDAQAVAARNTSALDEVSRRAEAFGAVAVAAEAAWEQARIHRETGRMGEAFASDLRVEWLLGLQPGQQPLATVRLDPILTEREREIVQLVVAGASNRSIGEDLFISYRTVESHLRRVYKRLGLSGRNELRSLVGGEAGEISPIATT